MTAARYAAGTAAVMVLCAWAPGAPLAAQTSPGSMNIPIQAVSLTPSSATATVGQQRSFRAAAVLSDGSSRILGGGGSPLWQLSFEPQIGVSVCGTGAVSFSSQGWSMDTTGTFRAVWSPTSPNTLTADGAMSLPTSVPGANLSAALACFSGSPTGSLSAFWSGSHYAGTYTFNGSSGDIAVVGLSWTSSNPAVATVDQTGRVTAVAPGDAVITATYGSLCWQMTASASGCFGTSSGSATLRVDPPSSGGGNGPIMTAGPDQTVQCSSYQGGAATLQGAIFFQPDTPITYTWSGAFGTASGVTPTVTLPLGSNVVTFTISNGVRSVSDTATVTVVDTFAPAISAATANPSTLWPVNRQMVPASIAVAAADVCDAQLDCRITAISGDDGMTAADAEITGPLTLALRATRSGRGDGRTYTARVECSDDAGNKASKIVEIVVPHDRRER